IESRFLCEKGPEYHTGNFKNWSLLRRHVHIIETYCKHNFRGKIPPKQNLSYILGLAEAEEARQSLSHPKSRRLEHENPAKGVLERRHGICFPDMSVPTSSLTAMPCNSSSSFNLLNCEPCTEEEENAQLEIALKASSFQPVSMNHYGHATVDQNMRHALSAVDQTRHTSTKDTSSETVCVNDVDVRIEPSEQRNEQTDENDAANVLMSLLNS
ncbi:Hypothetical predicted protein, partial [Paramuricea clavata]